jgi:hypothetical protein
LSPANCRDPNAGASRRWRSGYWVQSPPDGSERDVAGLCQGRLGCERAEVEERCSHSSNVVASRGPPHCRVCERVTGVHGVAEVSMALAWTGARPWRLGWSLHENPWSTGDPMLRQRHRRPRLGDRSGWCQGLWPTESVAVRETAAQEHSHGQCHMAHFIQVLTPHSMEFLATTPWTMGGIEILRTWEKTRGANLLAGCGDLPGTHPIARHALKCGARHGTKASTAGWKMTGSAGW